MKRVLFVVVAVFALTALAAKAADSAKINGWISDSMCGAKHAGSGAACVKKCIEGGGPVGLLTADDQLYLVIGDHQPLNKELSGKAAETVTLKGKVVERNGMKMIENAELQE